MQQHFAVQTQSGREFVARDAIRALGFPPYLPRYMKRTSHAGRSVRKAAPLFSQYLFVAFDPASMRWRSINSAHGVVCVLVAASPDDEDDPTPPYPIPVPAHVIAGIRAREDEDGFIQLDDDESLVLPPDERVFAPGDQLLVLNGPWANHVGIFRRGDADRVVALLSIFGRQTPTVLPRKSVVAV